MKKLQYAGRVYDQREKDALIAAANEFTLTAGKYAARFELALGEFLGVQHVSLVNSGSSANLLAFMALTQPELGERRIKRGDEVITTAACFPTTVAPIVQYGAVPVFVDITIPEYNVDCSQLEAALSHKTKAVVLAHTLGNPFDIQRVMDFCNEHKLWLIEDNCDALGSEYVFDGKTQHTGTVGHISTSSFYPAHHITTGEGGAVYTNHSLLNRIVGSLRDWGRDCICAPGADDTCGHRFSRQYGALPAGYDHKYVYSRFGYNLKMTDLQAAIGCVQMEKLKDFILDRHYNWYALRNLLHGVPGLILPVRRWATATSWFAFALSVGPDAGFTRSEITAHIEAHGIQTRPLFAGNILRHLCFEGVEEYRVAGDLGNTDFVMNNTFMVGVYPGLSEEDMKYIGETIKAFTEAYAHAA
jgi:CDP-6-deoxy-D-xylo-4-hexulose-3-dehydrase